MSKNLKNQYFLLAAFIKLFIYFFKKKNNYLKSCFNEKIEFFIYIANNYLPFFAFVRKTFYEKNLKKNRLWNIIYLIHFFH